MPPGHSLRIPFKKIIFLKKVEHFNSQCIDFTHFYNFFNKILLFKGLKMAPGALFIYIGEVSSERSLKMRV
jgi:hypothetical protein